MGKESQKSFAKHILIVGGNTNIPLQLLELAKNNPNDYLIIGDGEKAFQTLLQNKETDALKDRIGPNTKMHVWGHGGVTQDDKSHFMDNVLTKDILDEIQYFSPHPLNIHLFSCFAGAAAKDVQSLKEGSALVTHGEPDRTTLVLFNSESIVSSFHREPPKNPAADYLDNLFEYSKHASTIAINNGTKEGFKKSIRTSDLMKHIKILPNAPAILSTYFEKQQEDFIESYNKIFKNSPLSKRTIASQEQATLWIGNYLKHLLYNDFIPKELRDEIAKDPKKFAKVYDSEENYNDLWLIRHTNTHTEITDVIISSLSQEPVPGTSKEWELLMSAIAKKDSKSANELIERKVDLNVKSKYGFTPLMLAIFTNQPELAKKLINKGVNLDQQEFKGMSALNLAIIRGQKDIVLELADKKADINTRDLEGKTPLFYAITNNNIAIAKLLIDKKININLTDYKKNCPLAIAIAEGKTEIAKMLINHGADVNLLNVRNISPLMLAIHKGHTEVALLLIGKSPSLDNQDDLGHTPLMFAISQGNIAIAESLIKDGANLNIQDNDGNTALLHAINKGLPSIAKLLIEKGADRNLTNSKDISPLLTAISRDQTDISKLIIEKNPSLTKDQINLAFSYSLLRNNFSIAEMLIKTAKAEFDIADADGNTTLMKTLYIGKTDMAQMLISNGANINVKNSKGETPIMLAAEQGFSSIIAKLMQKGAIFDPEDKRLNGQYLIAAARNGDIEAFNKLLPHRLKLLVKDSNQDTALTIAIKQLHPEFAKLLIAIAPIELLNEEDKNLNSPLMLAVMTGQDSITKELIGKKVDLNLRDNLGNTPLMTAVMMGNSIIAKELMQAGADVTIPNQNGDTALSLAASNSELVAELEAKAKQQAQKPMDSKVKEPKFEDLGEAQRKERQSTFQKIGSFFQK